MDVTLTAAVRRQLTAMKRLERDSDVTQQRLASQRKVNSAFDDPGKFFAAQNLRFKAAAADRLIDALRQNVQVVKTALHGLDSMQKLLEQAEAVTVEALATENLPATSAPLSDQILADSPDAYWQLDETGGGTASNQGTAGGALNATYQGGVVLGQPALYTGGSTSAFFDGANDYVNIPSHPLINQAVHAERTIELVFNADNTTGRQVLYEEGGGTNAIAIYIDNGLLYFNARDAGDFGPYNINIPVVAGETYHVALQLDAPNNEFRGYLNGAIVGTGFVNQPLSTHGANVAIGAKRGGTFYHDGASGSNGHYFNGRISDVALYNSIVSESSLESKAALVIGDTGSPSDDEVNFLLQQLDLIVDDSYYRGTNLLSGDAMVSRFDEVSGSNFETQGQRVKSEDLGINGAVFSSVEAAAATLEELRAALQTLRQFSKTLANSINTIQTRDSFLNSIKNINLEGADNLTIANLDEEGANMLSIQTSQQIQVSVLSTTASRDPTTLLFDLIL